MLHANFFRLGLLVGFYAVFIVAFLETLAPKGINVTGVCRSALINMVYCSDSKMTITSEEYPRVGLAWITAVNPLLKRQEQPRIPR